MFHVPSSPKLSRNGPFTKFQRESADRGRWPVRPCPWRETLDQCSESETTKVEGAQRSSSAVYDCFELLLELERGISGCSAVATDTDQWRKRSNLHWSERESRCQQRGSSSGSRKELSSCSSSHVLSTRLANPRDPTEGCPRGVQDDQRLPPGRRKHRVEAAD